LTTKQFCLIYNVDITTLRKRIKLGQIEAYRKPVVREAKVKEHGRTGIYIYRGMDVAIFLGVTDRTVRRWAESGKIGFAKVGLRGARNRKYCIEDIRKMLAFKQLGGKCKNPTREAKRKAVMDWGYKQLGIEPPK
jgi:excisionase family DNA binding protein